MWTTVTNNIGSGHRYRLLDDNRPLSYGDFVRLLRHDDAFTGWYSQLLAQSEYTGFYWELPPVTRESLGQDAEFALIDAPALAGLVPDPAPFQVHFDAAADEEVLVFPNLGGDASLIVPCPLAGNDAYPQLATFLRRGPPQQIREFWRRVAETVYHDVTTAPRWLSTAGLGVAWLHARVDTRPKYYSHAPYARYP